MQAEPRRRLRLPSAAMAVALTALFVALSGTGYAVTALPKNSVGTPQLKNNSVTSAKVQNGTLRGADFAAGQIPAGPAGPAGTAGAAGTPGIVGSTIVYMDRTAIADGATDTEGARCENGKTALSGGAHVTGDGQLQTSAPTDAGNGLIVNGGKNFTRWVVTAHNPVGGGSVTAFVWVICAV